MPKSSHRLTVVSMSAGHSASARSLKSSFEVSDAEITALRDDVLLGRRTHALEWVQRRRSLLRFANPRHSNTPAMIGYLAQWADSGTAVLQVVSELLEHFPASERGKLPVRSYLFLRLADGILECVAGKPADDSFDFVIAAASGGGTEPEIPALAHFWKAQMQRKTGALDGAVRHANCSREIADRLGAAPLAAQARALEGLAMLDSGAAHGAELLRQAEAGLFESEEWLWLGRIEQALGRAALEDGRPQSAVEHFAKAESFFLRSAEPQPELGRTHFEMARAQRLMAVRLAGNIDSIAERRRRSPAGAATENALSSAVLRQRLARLKSGALSALEQAAAVFGSLGDRRALASVCLERAAICADAGDLQKAAEHANLCFAEGARNHDVLLMAQARFLQSRFEKMYYEEALDLDLSAHVERGYEYSKEALALALRCEAAPAIKRRLLTGIYVCQGLLLTSEFFTDKEAARECCRAASEYGRPSKGDELWPDYERLASKTRREGSVDARLRRWSEGLVEGKTFQQITEEFAELVIPAVWAREGKNVSRVVAKLSISPKKVRRILTRAGLKG
jgi:tetratricopeptide (TPR) repeat protein